MNFKVIALLPEPPGRIKIPAPYQRPNRVSKAIMGGNVSYESPIVFFGHKAFRRSKID